MVVQKQRRPGELFWPKIVLKKWLNLRSKDLEFAADEVEDDDGSDIEDEDNCDCGDAGEALRRPGGDVNDDNLESAPYKLRRRNSETLRAQYINTKELRVCVDTWNAGGKSPPTDLDIADWLGVGHGEPAHIYVLGFQEVVPLNAGNVFGAEDVRPALAWESLIRGALRRAQPSTKPKYRCYSHPPSPSRFDPSSNAAAAAVDELLPGGTDTETETDDDAPSSLPEPFVVGATPRKLSRLNHFSFTDDDSSPSHDDEPDEPGVPVQQRALLRSLSRADRVGLVWPEQPLDLLPSRSSSSTLAAAPSFKASKSFRAYRSFRGTSRVADVDDEDHHQLAMIPPDLDLELELRRKKSRSPFVRIVSKQMVGVFLTVWVRRGIRKCVQNLKVSTVGVGAMGYIGNKGAVSVSMSVYQTMFCFVCAHLASGEKPGDVHKRNADVQEIHRRTRFFTPGDLQLPKDIYDHERIFWLGDLNYRLDVSYQKAHQLISTKDWSQLAEMDQLKRELKKGRAFDGWTEGILEFAPTYKYELNSDKYIGDDQKGGRRTPAWCDRILSFGKGLRLLSYRRSDLRLSDHRPVTATYAAEVEVFSSRKLQRALTLTDAEVEGGQVVPDLDF
ncbi:hypothetical protein QOZ80_1BG0061060 [Eleusine coracana subsp. coracana]|nr:hypothetical protein QOZ80_1BG0061060 [Eleusine coracana subsp. coracana]